MAYDQSALKYIGPVKKEKTKRVSIPKKHIDYFGGLTDEFKGNITKTKKSGKVVAKVPKSEFYISSSQPFKGDGDKELPSSAGEYKLAKNYNNQVKVGRAVMGGLMGAVVAGTRHIKSKI